MKEGLSIILPAYNEEASIGSTLDEISSSLEGCGFEWETVIVDDCSTDSTLNVLKERGVKHISHDVNKGYGASIKDGAREVSFDCIAIIDGDGTYPPHYLREMYARMRDDKTERVDMVVGARIGANVNIPTVRKPAKWAINQLANYLTGVKIPDLNSGLRVMRRDVFEKYTPLLPDGFSLTTTITLAMLTNNYRVEYMEIDYRKRSGRSKIRPIRDTLNFIQLIVRTVMYFDPLKVFVPLGLILLLTSMAVLILSFLFTDKVMDISTVVLLVGSIQVLATGMIADLIIKRDKL